MTMVKPYDGSPCSTHWGTGTFFTSGEDDHDKDEDENDEMLMADDEQDNFSGVC